MEPRLEHLRVALGERAGSADLASFLCVADEELSLVDLLFEPVVDPVQMRLLDRDLAVPDANPTPSGDAVCAATQDPLLPACASFAPRAAGQPATVRETKVFRPAGKSLRGRPPHYAEAYFASAEGSSASR